MSSYFSFSGFLHGVSGTRPLKPNKQNYPRQVKCERDQTEQRLILCCLIEKDNTVGTQS